jgi:hypothetical protein
MIERKACEHGSLAEERNKRAYPIIPESFFKELCAACTATMAEDQLHVYGRRIVQGHFSIRK